MKGRLSVVRIRIQKDEYRFGTPAQIAVDSVFAASSDSEGELVISKRMIVEGTCHTPKGDVRWMATISPKSGLVILTKTGTGLLSLRSLAMILRDRLAHYSLDVEWRSRRGFDLIEMHGQERAVCATTDWQKLGDIFHQWRDFKGVDFESPDNWLDER